MAFVSEEYEKDTVFGYIREQLTDLFPNNQSTLSVDAFHTIKFIVLEYAFNQWRTSQLGDLARVAEKAELYGDMCKFMRKLVTVKCEKGEKLDEDERNLLSIAYKNVVSAKRASWRTLAGGVDDADDELLEKYKAFVESELEPVCNEVLSLLTDHLCKNVEGDGDENEVFYLKMCGDYYRYLWEFVTEPEDKVNALKCNAEEYYQQAMNAAEANLHETHVTRLGLALNFSVFLYEILKEPERACALAKKSYDDAIEKYNKHTTKDILMVMGIIRDNHILWTSNQDDGDDQ